MTKLNTPRVLVRGERILVYFTTRFRRSRQWALMRLEARGGFETMKLDQSFRQELDGTSYAPTWVEHDGDNQLLLVRHQDNSGKQVGVVRFQAATETGPFEPIGPVTFPVPEPYYGAVSCAAVPDDEGLRFLYTVTGPKQMHGARRIMQARTSDWCRWEQSGPMIDFDGVVAGPAVIEHQGRRFLLCCCQPKWTDHNDWDIALLEEEAPGSWSLRSKVYLPDHGHPSAFALRGESYFLADDNLNFDRFSVFRFCGPDRAPQRIGRYLLASDTFVSEA